MLDRIGDQTASIDDIARIFEEDVAPAAHFSHYAVEDWVTLAVFWAMALAVFLQFFTRYVLNDSLSWTEEVATNLLMVVVFLGSVMCVRRARHIHVDILYRYLPARVGRVLALLVDLCVIGFFAYMSILIWRFVGMVADQRMISIDFPRSYLFYTLLVAFVLMALRSIQVFVADVRRGYTVLERPGAFDEFGE